MQIPVYTASEHLIGAVDSTQFEALDEDVEFADGLRLVRNKRGHVTRVYLPGQPEQRPVDHGNAGQTFLEPVTCGHVWSMVLPWECRQAEEALA